MFIINTFLEESDYMPFGTRFTDSAAPTDSANRHRFAGKEKQAFAGLPYVDFGARLYDPTTARWDGDINKNSWPRLFPVSLFFYIHCIILSPDHRQGSNLDGRRLGRCSSRFQPHPKL